jgi:hypothetical protein
MKVALLRKRSVESLIIKHDFIQPTQRAQLSNYPAVAQSDHANFMYLILFQYRNPCKKHL